LKRGIFGVFHHVSEAHLQRYLNEFDFRYTHRIARGVDDVARADLALLGVKNKRLTYTRTSSQAGSEPYSAAVLRLGGICGAVGCPF
jgi:alkyl sulfatase BDS1-like metallo-beta-lactamase superfamily hydrolase